MAKLFNVGDKVYLKDEKSYKGTITKMVYIPESHELEEFQWIYLNNSTVNSQFPSYLWELEE